MPNEAARGPLPGSRGGPTLRLSDQICQSHVKGPRQLEHYRVARVDSAELDLPDVLPGQPAASCEFSLADPGRFSGVSDRESQLT